MSPSSGPLRALIPAAALLLLLSAGLWMSGVFGARQMEADARLVHEALQLKSSAHQLTKGLLLLERDLRLGAPTESTLAELDEARTEFDDARAEIIAQLNTVPAVTLLDAAEAREDAGNLLRQLGRTWDPINREVGPLIVNGEPTLKSTSSAIQQALPRHARLARQAAELGLSLEHLADRRRENRHRLQGIALLAALLNLGWIVVKLARAVIRQRVTAA